LEEGRRLEAFCRSDVEQSELRLEVARHNGRQRESAPLGLSFSNGHLSLGAVTKQDNGLEFICSSKDASDTLTLHVLSSSTEQEGSRGYPDGGYDQGYQYGGEQQQQQQGGYVEVTVEPNDARLSPGQTATLTCRVKGAEQFTVTWGKYAHDTNLPNYARQEGNSVVIAPTNDSPAEQMYLQCSVNVPGQPQAYLAYAPVTIRGTDETRKKKKKRRS
jgi:hypothetical protein